VAISVFKASHARKLKNLRLHFEKNKITGRISEDISKEKVSCSGVRSSIQSFATICITEKNKNPTYLFACCKSEIRKSEMKKSEIRNPTKVTF
jgi:hypothetical protein